MKNMDRAIRKVKKALALSNKNSNEEESQTAMLMAQRIMAKHGLSMSDVEGDDNSKSSEVIEGDATNYGRLHWWQKLLSSILADNFRCYPVIYKGAGKTKLVFVGKEEDVGILVEVFKFANNAIKHHAKEYLKQRGIKGNRAMTNAIKNDYISGFLSGLKDKFKEQVESEELGLILVKDGDVTNYFEGMNTRKSTNRSNHSRMGDEQAMGAGYEQGKSFNHGSKSIQGV